MEYSMPSRRVKAAIVNPLSSGASTAPARRSRLLTRRARRSRFSPLSIRSVIVVVTITTTLRPLRPRTYEVPGRTLTLHPDPRIVLSRRHARPHPDLTLPPAHSHRITTGTRPKILRPRWPERLRQETGRGKDHAPTEKNRAKFVLPAPVRPEIIRPERPEPAPLVAPGDRAQGGTPGSRRKLGARRTRFPVRPHGARPSSSQATAGARQFGYVLPAQPGQTRKIPTRPIRQILRRQKNR